MSNNTISMSKEYRTKSGEVVTLLNADAPVEGSYKVVGVLHGLVQVWTKTGSYLSDTTSDNDLVEVREFDNFKIDEPVFVRDSENGQWYPRHFAGVDKEGRPKAWHDGTTSWTTDGSSSIYWKQCRRPTEEELAAKNNL